MEHLLGKLSKGRPRILSPSGGQPQAVCEMKLNCLTVDIGECLLSSTVSLPGIETKVQKVGRNLALRAVRREAPEKK